MTIRGRWFDPIETCVSRPVAAGPLQPLPRVARRVGLRKG